MDTKDDLNLAVQLGVLLGQIEAFAQAGRDIGLLPSEFSYLEKTALPRAQSIASGIKSLPDQSARFARLRAALAVGPSNLENIRSILVEERKALVGDFPRPQSTPVAYATDLGVLFGNAEAFADLAPRLAGNWPSIRDWIRTQIVTTIPDHAKQAVAFDRVDEITGFLAARLDKLVDWGKDTEDLQQSIEAVRRLLLQQLSPSAKGLMAGAAKVPLLVSVGGQVWVGDQHTSLDTLMPSGFAKPDPHPKNIHDVIQCRALVLSSGDTKIAIASVDLVMVYQDVLDGYKDVNLLQQVTNRVSAVTGIQDILVTATHNHSSFDWTAFGHPEPDGSSTMAKLISDAIILAAGLSDPAEVGVGRGSAHIGFNRNPRTVDANGQITSHQMLTGTGEPSTRDKWVQDHPLDPIDDDVTVLHFQRIVKTPRNSHIATLANYACHGVVLGPEYPDISADWPGATMRMLEERYGQQGRDTAPYIGLVLQGCAGDIDPWFALTTDPGQVETAGRNVADGAIDAITHVPKYFSAVPLNFRSQKVPIEKPPQSVTQPNRAEVNTVTFGGNLSAAIVTFPAEMFVEYAKEVRTKAATRGFQTTLVCGYTNDALGYVPSESAYDTHGYQTDGWTPINKTAVYGNKETGERLVTAAISLLP